ncbi:acyltransferase family protein [Peribacillus frigoritolerans]|uniref:acyltransferase family protein n=1 Tax=Peribacillus frigoritolerans TaxID=450367 RepID=UPI0021A6D0D3|nr:acyltransferase family protein [Peribacillus frigoritolerans]MCT1391418.1 acyltransferase family protein [Peribacillus frigoritolerans]
MKSQRESWLDIAKGLGIILVVIGHSENAVVHHYLFWFHMPLFFMISGYLFRPLVSISELKLFIIKKTKQLLIPYVSFGLTIILSVFIVHLDPIELLKNVIKLLYGGETLVGYLTVFWYVTVFFITQIIFALITLKIKEKRIRILLVFTFYLIAHVITWITPFKNLVTPWNVDAVLIAISYFAIGYYGRKLIKMIITKKSTFLLTTLSILVILSLDKLTFIRFELDLKNQLHSNIVLDILVPVIFSLFIFCFSNLISSYSLAKPFEYLGTISMTIMFLHVPINMFLRNDFGFNYGVPLYTFFGVVFPILIHMLILNKLSFTQRYFIGKNTVQNTSLTKEFKKAVQ